MNFMLNSLVPQQIFLGLNCVTTICIQTMLIYCHLYNFFEAFFPYMSVFSFFKNFAALLLPVTRNTCLDAFQFYLFPHYVSHDQTEYVQT